MKGASRSRRGPQKKSSKSAKKPAEKRSGQGRAKRVYRLDASPLRGVLDAGRGAGWKNPVFRVGPYRIGYGPANLTLYASSPAGFLGRIDSGGIFRPTPLADEGDLGIIRVASEDPLRAAREASKVMSEAGLDPRCACCGGYLANPKDKARGIGRTCYVKWGFEEREKSRDNNVKERRHGKEKRRHQR